MGQQKLEVFEISKIVQPLPQEMLRKGRFDDLFFVDFPNQQERETIWKVQIQKYGRRPDDFDLVQLAKATDGLPGSEIENVFTAFNNGHEPTDLTVAKVLTDFVPLSKLMAEQIAGLRNWTIAPCSHNTRLRFNAQNDKDEANNPRASSVHSRMRTFVK